MRSAAYFEGAGSGSGHAVVVLVCWVTAGLALLALTAVGPPRRSRGMTGAEWSSRQALTLQVGAEPTTTGHQTCSSRSSVLRDSSTMRLALDETTAHEAAAASTSPTPAVAAPGGFRRPQA